MFYLPIVPRALSIFRLFAIFIGVPSGSVWRREEYSTNTTMTVNVARIILWQVSKQNSPRVNGMKKFRLKSCLHKLVHKYRVFSLTRPASMQIYWNKRKRLHNKGVQLPQDDFGTPTWAPFHCFGTPIWTPWRHVKTLYKRVECFKTDGAKSKSLRINLSKEKKKKINE